MKTLLDAARSLTNHLLDYLLGTRLAPERLPAADSHRHWDRSIRTWK
ncbi:MAG: hypothetical protein ACHQXA_10750 [Gemmatimonadales bacterium]